MSKKEVVIQDLVPKISWEGEGRGDAGTEELHLGETEGREKGWVQREKGGELNRLMPGTLTSDNATC